MPRNPYWWFFLAILFLVCSSHLVSAGLNSGNCTGNFVAYWGQNTIGAKTGRHELDLDGYCNTTTYDAIVISFVISFDTYPTMNFALHCETSCAYAANMLCCPKLISAIKYCQGQGKTIILSLGGAAGSYSFTSDSHAVAFADTVWYTFLGGSNSSINRPFQDAILDGIDLDIEGGSSTGYTAFIGRLRSYFVKDTRKTYFITGAPQCPFPDHFLGPDQGATNGTALSWGWFDFVMIQFYNNYCGLFNYDAGVFNYATWHTWAISGDNPNPNIKLLVGAPSRDTAGAGYVAPNTLQKILGDMSAKYPQSMGGLMIWDIGSAEDPVDATTYYGGKTWGQVMASYLKPPGSKCLTASPSATPQASGTPSPSFKATGASPSPNPTSNSPPSVNVSPSPSPKIQASNSTFKVDCAANVIARWGDQDKSNGASLDVLCAVDSGVDAIAVLGLSTFNVGSTSYSLPFSLHSSWCDSDCSEKSTNAESCCSNIVALLQTCKSNGKQLILAHQTPIQISNQAEGIVYANALIGSFLSPSSSFIRPLGSEGLFDAVEVMLSPATSRPVAIDAAWNRLTSRVGTILIGASISESDAATVSSWANGTISMTASWVTVIGEKWWDWTGRQKISGGSRTAWALSASDVSNGIGWASLMLAGSNASSTIGVALPSSLWNTDGTGAVFLSQLFKSIQRTTTACSGSSSITTRDVSTTVLTQDVGSLLKKSATGAGVSVANSLATSGNVIDSGSDQVTNGDPSDLGFGAGVGVGIAIMLFVILVGGLVFYFLNKESSLFESMHRDRKKKKNLALDSSVSLTNISGSSYLNDSTNTSFENLSLPPPPKPTSSPPTPMKSSNLPAPPWNPPEYAPNAPGNPSQRKTNLPLPAPPQINLPPPPVSPRHPGNQSNRNAHHFG